MSDATGPEPVIDRLVEAYNRGDSQAFASLFANDAVIVGHPDHVLHEGAERILAHYSHLFAQDKEGRNDVLHRIVIGDRVIEHERITSGIDGSAYEMASIYTVRDGRIARVDFITQGRTDA